MALNQNGSIRWFNSAAAIQVESKKPTRFIITAIRKLFCNIYQVYQACFSYGYIEPNKTALSVVYIESKTHDELVQISTQLHWNRPHALNSIATLPTYLQKGFYLHSLLQSQKSR